MLDALYQDSTSRVLDDMQARPMPRPAPEPGFWSGVWSAAPRGFAVAVNETVRTGFRAITANADAVMLRQQQEADDFTAEAIFKRRLELADERKQADAQMRAAVDYWQPDPGTVGAAAEAVQGFTRFATKAVGYSLAVGPVAGAALTGADIGGAEYINLRDQGVDEATAAKVGAVRGAAAGVTVALPVAGRGLASTAALVGVGGPGAFVAEQAAARKILADADYSKLAGQIDPFDPVGLSVATAGAALFGFGAFALRGSGRAKPKGEPAAEPRQVPPQEAVDAAQLVVAREVADQQALARPGDLAADAIERRAQERAVAQMAAGERVDVADTVPLRPGDPMPAPLAQMIARVDEVAAEARAAESAPFFDEAFPELQPAPVPLDQVLADEAIRGQLTGMREDTGWAQEGGRILREDGEDQMSAVVGRTTWIPNAEWWPGRPKGLTEAQVKRAIDKALAGEKLTKRETDMVRYLVDVAAERERSRDWWPEPDDLRAVDAPVDSGEAAMVARAAALDEGRVEDLARQFEDDGAGFMRAIKEWLDGEQPARPAEGGAANQPAPGAAAARTGARPDPGAARAGPVAPADAGLVAAATRVDPALQVELPDGTRTTAADALRAIQEQAAAEVNDAQLLQVAAACAIGA
ncbi:MAG: hypothetical protein MUC68_06945 [Burkholderiaceae bacterium]|jgi:hypothetical protein|nr:hypothetical protein [Burkholderiaceae bacterium]